MLWLRNLKLALLFVALIASHSFAAEKASDVPTPSKPVTQRFAADDIAEEPSFQKHVVPLFGRLGCNGRACHGSFQGRGGFQLSLFGYDFKFDHDALLKKDDPRVDREKPLESLLLTKPVSEEEHEGGKRFEKDGWEYHLLKKWIAAGAKFEAAQVEKLVALEVKPAEILFAKAGQAIQLQAVAVWENGTREDVTPLCRFVSGSDQIVKVNENGLLTGNDRGDTYVVVAYDKAVVTIPVMRPVGDRTGSKYPTVATRTKIDELTTQKLRKLGIVPSEQCTDAEFLRRVSLDLCGTLPSAREVEAFLANSSPNKRAEKIEELLETPAYAAWWATKFCDYTGNNDQQLNGTNRTEASRDWYDWIYARLANNSPYDEIVAGIAVGTSRKPGQSYREYCEQMCAAHKSDATATFSDWPSMPNYWMRSNLRQSEDRAIGFAYSFMGVRIQCAQCHKHPFDVWSKQDFEDFKAFFSRVNYTQRSAPLSPEDKESYTALLTELGIDPKMKGNDLDKALAKFIKEGKTVPLGEVYSLPPKPVAANKKEKEKDNGKPKNVPMAVGKLLGTDEVIKLNEHSDPRQPLMDWLRAPKNPYFAKALVNRVWANYFNVGIVEPPDDMSLGNPPSNKALLDYLAQGFIDHKFDLKWLHREICNSDTYQRSWRTNDTNAKDERNFSHAVPRRLPAEVAYDAVQRATWSDEKAAPMLTEIKNRAIYIAASNAGANGAGKEGFALKVFGRSIRESNCDCDRSPEATLLQTVYLQNDSEVLAALVPSKGYWMDQVNSQLNPPKAGETKSRSEFEQVKVELAKAKLRLEQVVGEKKDSERVKKFAARVKELEEKLASMKEEKTSTPAAAVPTALADIVREAYLRTLSRPATPSEMERSLQFIAEAKTPILGMRDLMWTLLNTKEFIVNH